MQNNKNNTWWIHLDTCSPPCAAGFTCNDGVCLCGPYNGTVCTGSTPSCLTSNNYSVGYDLTSKCRACTKQLFTASLISSNVQGSCLNPDDICLDDGSCGIGTEH